MILREVLEKLVEADTPVLLSDGDTDWEPGALLNRLSDQMLKRNAHFQPGLYIAEINNGGYLGQVLYKVKQK